MTADHSLHTAFHNLTGHAAWEHEAQQQLDDIREGHTPYRTSCRAARTLGELSVKSLRDI